MKLHELEAIRRTAISPDPTLKAALATIKKEIKDGYGKRCKTNDFLCSRCIVWNAYETLEVLLD